jgi:GTP pyrophosphokinase
MGCSDAVAVPGQPKPPWRDRKAAYLDRLAGEDDPDVLLVSACDKLHNARAIIADLRAIGSALWDRFTQADPAAQLWYYQGSGTKRGGYPSFVPLSVTLRGLSNGEPP